MQIIVGSKSKHKIEAVRAALRLCGFDTEQYRIGGVSAASGIPEQPAGLEQTRIGAENRSRNAKEASPGADMWIGIESGLVHAYASHYDIAFVVITCADGKVFSAMAGGHEVPVEHVHAAHARGFKKHTAGAAMAEKTGCDATDGTSFITEGVVSRMDVLTQAMAIALADWKRRTPRAEQEEEA